MRENSPIKTDRYETSIIFTACSYEDATAVITTGKDKFYSIGLDLEELESLPTDSEKIKHLGDFQKLLGRVLTFPLPTIAAINGMLCTNNWGQG